jgi:rhodanese-related sulfurtransferase
MIQTIQANELKTLQESGQRFQLIDVRSPREYAEGHLPCAVNLPVDEVESRLDDLHDHDPVILVCKSGSRAQLACELLAPHRNELLLLNGGTDAWEQLGYPVVRSVRARLPLMRQVQLAVGPLTLAGSLGAIFVQPMWALLAAAVGAGLTFAGATGWCGMAILLGKMPWNRPSPLSQARPVRSCCQGGIE